MEFLRDVLKRTLGTALGGALALIFVNQIAAAAVVFPPISMLTGPPQVWKLPDGAPSVVT